MTTLVQRTWQRTN